MRIMNKIYSILIAIMVAAVVIITAPYSDARRTYQEKARQQMKSGQLMPYAEIERNVRKRMKNMDYLGSQFNARNSTYRFKFLSRDRASQKTRVIFVDVDAKSGEILRTR